MRFLRLRWLPVLFVPGILLISSHALAADLTLDEVVRGLDTLWVLIAAFLVFFMQAGFGMVEAGFIRAKNTVNILMKNFIDYGVASIMFFIMGYAFMFGNGSGFIGTEGFGLSNAPNPSGVSLYAFFLFQAAFCGAAATIVAGAMSERMKFRSYLMYTVFISAVVYPIVGHWVWSGAGWLSSMGFADFAGSTVVHATGGFAALAGVLFLGPRIGKFGPDGSPRAVPGHSLPLAALGVFILWFGWFGFNPGSALAVSNGEKIALIATNTNLAAAAGAISAMITVWIKYGKPDLSMTMNGALAGLVAITAPCAFVMPGEAIVIGLIAGIIVVYGVLFLDYVRIDDPVGAIPVHGFNGVWGTLAVGLFGHRSLGLAHEGLFHGGGLTQLGIQALGVAACTLFVFVSMSAVFYFIHSTFGLRVSRDEELRGLDIDEHGMEAYSGFQVFTTQ